ncbi:MAG: PEP-CTERM sorting domain-containing protein [Phycisphaerales bacterium]|nr:PEP-CTERM sorting domain-containing protein [Phycisphaerales bacterium]
MTRGLLIGVVVLLTGIAQSADLRLFFSVDDPIGTGHPGLPAPNGTTGAINVVAAPGNPLLSPTELQTQTLALAFGLDTTHRFHVWATGTLGEFDPHVWDGIALTFAIEGPATVVGAGMLNVTSPPSSRRWQSNSDFDARNGNVNFQGVVTAGVQLPAANDGWSNGSEAVYLGYLDVAGNGGASELYIQPGTSGVTRRNGNQQEDNVYFGWDGPEPNDFPPYWLPDARIVPEPGGAALLGLGAALAFGRRGGAIIRR